MKMVEITRVEKKKNIEEQSGIVRGRSYRVSLFHSEECLTVGRIGRFEIDLSSSPNQPTGILEPVLPLSPSCCGIWLEDLLSLQMYSWGKTWHHYGTMYSNYI